MKDGIQDGPTLTDPIDTKPTPKRERLRRIFPLLAVFAFLLSGFCAVGSAGAAIAISPITIYEAETLVTPLGIQDGPDVIGQWAIDECDLQQATTCDRACMARAGSYRRVISSTCAVAWVPENYVEAQAAMYSELHCTCGFVALNPSDVASSW